MTEWGIVAVVAVGAAIFLGVVGVAWDFKFDAICGCTVHEPMIGKHWYDPICEGHAPVLEPAPPSEIVRAVHRRGRHLRTD